MSHMFCQVLAQNEHVCLFASLFAKRSVEIEFLGTVVWQTLPRATKEERTAELHENFLPWLLSSHRRWWCRKETQRAAYLGMFVVDNCSF